MTELLILVRGLGYGTKGLGTLGIRASVSVCRSRCMK
jgi:hypothetical protein